MIEKFCIAEIAALRRDLIHNGLDSFQIAEAIKVFVGCRGYGISGETALDAACRIERRDYSVECLHNQLESSSWVM